MRLDHLLSKEQRQVTAELLGQDFREKVRRCLIFEVLTPNGGVAQLGEHLLCKQGVIGSIPFISTKSDVRQQTTDAGQ